MTVAVASLERRSTAELRAFVRAQHVEVERHPDRVEQPVAAGPSFGPTYRRFLVRRAPLEGICRYYESYNADGDENDWCILIEPDPSYAWMVDPEILASLSLFAGSPMDLDEVKVIDDRFRVIECELTPDDGLYDKFLRSGLPIQSGGSKGQNKHEGPEGDRVGVYGVFCGDYGHGGRPEIHPFDAFWKQRHSTGRAERINWDFGVFQDDSNRFNEDWSEAPIDVEFRVPFCVDVPVTLRTPRTHRVRFALTKSDVCRVVGKNTRDANAPDLTETFTAKTVRLNPNRENRVEVTVENAGVAGRPFRLAFEDVTYTTAGRFGFFSLQAWLAGYIVMRVAVDQDGFAYWNLGGPNSTTAADAEGDDAIVIDPGDVKAALAAEPPEPSEPEPMAVKVTAARPVVSTGKNPAMVAEVSVTVGHPDAVASTDRLLTVRPRENPPILDEATGRTIELESFDLFALATASTAPPSDPPARIQADVSGSIARLAGLESSRRPLRAQPATVEVDDFVTVDVGVRYAPYREGEVQGEEQSLLSESLNETDTGPVRVRCEIQFIDATGQSRRIRTADVGARDGDGQTVARLEAGKGGQRLVVGPLGGVPTVLRVEGVVEDRFGLRSEISTVSANFRVVNARPWVEHATGTAVGDLRQRLHQADQRARRAPTHEARASAGMLRCLVEVIEALDGEPAVPATQVAGAVRLAARVQQLLPAGASARQSHQRR